MLALHGAGVPDGRAPLPRWWSAFVLPWLLVMVVTVALLVRERPARGDLGAAIALMAALAGGYLWLTLRGAMTAADLSAGGPTARDVRRRVAVLAAMAAIVVALMRQLPTAGLWWHVMYVVLAAGLALPTRIAAVTIVAAVLATLGATWLIAGRFEIMLLIELAIGGGAVAVRQLTLTVAQLRDAREELARRAVLDERLRFARDLHDLVGHSLSLIAIKSELARRLLPANADASAREIRDVEQGARDALRHVRAAVLGYRQPSLAEELAAARELLAAAGIAAQVQVRDADDEPPLPGAVDALLAWTVRESVTNVVRHSRAQRCAITVERRSDGVRVAVSDDGRGSAASVLTASAPHDVARSGSGLAGLAERAAALDARLHAGRRPEGGFSVVVEAPTSRADRGGAS